jgi:hypothetical protein
MSASGLLADQWFSRPVFWCVNPIALSDGDDSDFSTA